MASRHPKSSIAEPVRGGYTPLPWSVTDSAAYILLSHKAKALLVDMARLHNGRKGNNGHLHAGLSTMKKRGWKSNDTLANALRELTNHRLIQETRKGGLNAGASLYAITWASVTDFHGIDLPANQFDLDGYRLWKSTERERSRKTLKATVARKTRTNGNKGLPSYGTENAKTEPSNGTESASNRDKGVTTEKSHIPIDSKASRTNDLYRSTVTCAVPLDGNKEYIAISGSNSNDYKKTPEELVAFWLGYLGYWASKTNRATNLRAA